MGRNIKKFDISLHKDFLPCILEPNDKLYIDLLKKYIDDKRINNIALTGGYGSGKSSIIDTYIKYNNESECCKVSLAKYNNFKNNKNDNENDNNDDLNNNNINSYENVYEEIIKQIFFSIPKKKVRRSRFSYLYKKAYYFITIPIAILFTLLFGLIVYKNLNVILPLSNELVNLIKIIYFIAVSVLFGLLLFVLINNKEIDSIKVKDLSLKFNLYNEKSNPLDKYLEEIIYLFKNSDINIVFFEDLDRYNDVRIFVELKELNKSINLALKNDDKYVTFVYAIREDLFLNSYDRFKFFDACISVVPYSSLYNAFDLFVKEFDSINKTFNIEIENEALNSVSLYVHEFRAVRAIANDFVIFYSRIQNVSPNINIVPEQLLYLMAYKNLYNYDYVKIYEGESILNRILNYIREPDFNNYDSLNDIYHNCKYNISDRELFLKKINDFENKYIEEIRKFNNNYIVDSDLIKFVLQGIFEGYINDNYHKYISYIYNITISENDNNFILYVKDNSGKYKYESNYKLDSPKTVINRLNISDFSGTKILNYALIDYISSDETLYNSSKVGKIYRPLLKSIKDNNDFIVNCINGIDKFSNYLVSIFDSEDKIYNLLFNCSSNISMYENVINLIFNSYAIEVLKSVNLKLEKDGNSFKNIILSCESSELFNGIDLEKIVSIIKEFNIVFTSIESYGFTSSVLKYIVDNNNYVINKSNLIYIIDKFYESKLDNNEKLSFRYIKDIDQVGKYITLNSTNFFEYFDNVWLNRDNFRENEESLMGIYKFLLHDQDRLQSFVEKVDTLVNDISKIPDRQLQYILTNYNKFEINSQNVSYLVTYNILGNREKFIKENFDKIINMDFNNHRYSNSSNIIYKLINNNSDKLKFLYKNAYSFGKEEILTKLSLINNQVMQEFVTKDEIYINKTSKIFAKLLEKIKFLEIVKYDRNGSYMRIKRL